jgi:hypothetical protein
LAQDIDGCESVFAISGGGLRSNQLQAVVEVIRKEIEERAIELGSFFPIEIGNLVASFDGQTLLARKACGKIESFLGFDFLFLTVTETVPGGG